MAAYEETLNYNVRMSIKDAIRDLDVLKDAAKRKFEDIMGEPVHFEQGSDRKKAAENNRKFNEKTAKEQEMQSRKVRGAWVMAGLSIMFFSRQVTGAISSWLKPAEDAVGIMSIWNAALELLFLPVMIAILPYFLDFLNFVSQLSDGWKMAIGVVALLLLGLFSLTGAAASIGLLITGLGALATALGLTTAAAGAATAAETANAGATATAGGAAAVAGAGAGAGAASAGWGGLAALAAGALTNAALPLTLLSLTPALGYNPQTGASDMIPDLPYQPPVGSSSSSTTNNQYGPPTPAGFTPSSGTTTGESVHQTKATAQGW